MSTISAIITYALMVFAVVWVIDLLWCLFRSAIRKEPIQKNELFLLANPIKQKPVLSSIVILLVLAVFLYNDATFTDLLGIEKPLSKRVEGTYCYYVEAKEEKSGKDYTVPAEIDVIIRYDGNDISGVDYSIEKLIFDDGRTIVFDNFQYASFDYANRCYDIKGDTWKCRLTERHAYSSLVEETTFSSTQDVIELVVIVLVVMINWLGGLSLAHKLKKQYPDL